MVQMGYGVRGDLIRHRCDRSDRIDSHCGGLCNLKTEEKCCTGLRHVGTLFLVE